MIKRQKTTNIRKRLFVLNPHCHWCGDEVFDNINPTADKAVTLDHIKSRLECEDANQYRSSRNHVLACYRCNNERNQAVTKLLNKTQPQRMKALCRKPSLPITTHAELMAEARALPATQANTVSRIRVSAPRPLQVKSPEMRWLTEYWNEKASG